MKKRMSKRFHINPKFRAYGKARLDIARRAGSKEDWERLWKTSAYPFPFQWGSQWKQCIEYRVDDFAAEVGFYIDILGLPVNALDPDYAMFTSPDGDFYFSVVPALDGEVSTPPDSFRIQFMVENIQETALELERRGIPFEQWPSACADGSPLYIGYFRTPHGLCIDLWGRVEEGGTDEPVEAPAPDKKSEYNSGEIEPDSLKLSQLEKGPASEQIDFFLNSGQDEDPEDSIPFPSESSFHIQDNQSEQNVVEIEYEYIDDV